MMLKAAFLRFKGPVRFGEPGIGLERASTFCPSDTLFSAITNAVASLEGPKEAEEFLSPFLEGREPFRISSAFPFVGGRLFVRRPALPPPLEGEGATPELRKKLKETKFVSLQTLRRLWIEGPPSPEELPQLLDADREAIRSGMRMSLSPRVQLDRCWLTSGLYHARALHFSEEAGLWFAVQMREESALPRLEAALRFLAEEGIGGERSCGLGRFEVEWKEAEMPSLPEEEDGAWLLLSLYWPNEDEREERPWTRGAYELVERRGWAFSPLVRREARRKRVVMFSEGSAFLGLRPQGGMAEVTPPDWPEGAHKVYRYGLALCTKIASPAPHGQEP